MGIFQVEIDGFDFDDPSKTVSCCLFKYLPDVEKADVQSADAICDYTALVHRTRERGILLFDHSPCNVGKEKCSGRLHEIDLDGAIRESDLTPANDLHVDSTLRVHGGSPSFRQMPLFKYPFHASKLLFIATVSAEFKELVELQARGKEVFVFT